MKTLFRNPLPIWNSLLLVSVIFATFILPVLSVQFQIVIFRPVYSLIYLAAILSLEKRRKDILVLFGLTLFLEWISILFNWEGITTLAKGMSVLFFLVVVVSLIWQIAAAKRVDFDVILNAIVGYLLTGLIFTMFISYIMQHDPDAYNVSILPGTPGSIKTGTSVPLYYSFVTLATLGYGDIVPLKPYTRSLATWITISGQFYIAIIISLLVGKFLSQRGEENK